MKLTLLLLLSRIRITLANPARPDCGRIETFTMSNECGIGYGGTWTVCASGMRAMPTFTVPACPLTSAASPPSSTRTTSEKSHAITTTPSPVSPRDRDLNTTTSCFRRMICIDGLASCEGKGTRFGGCYDMCTPSHSPTAPACSAKESAAAPVKTVGGDGGSQEQSPEAERKQLDVCVEKPFLCAPPGW